MSRPSSKEKAFISAEPTVTIERLAEGGVGVGKVDGMVCFVPYTVPGDQAVVRIEHSGRRFLRGVVKEIIVQGPSRRSALCPLFGKCGGCNWLHIDESFQVRAKAEILAHALGIDFTTVVPSPKSLGYRGPARLHFSAAEKGSVTLGFMHAHESRIENVFECPILDPGLNQCIAAIRETLAEESHIRGEIRMAMGKSRAAVCFTMEDRAPPSFYRAAAALPESLFSGVGLSIEGLHTTLKGSPIVEIDGTDDQPFIAPVQSFGQANTGINRELAATLRKWMSKRKYRRMLELFCGAGNLTITVAPFVESALASELDAEACAAAVLNLKQRGISHVSIKQGEALEVYRQNAAAVDLVVLNPPRTGHHDLAKKIASNRHQAVLYVSCNPSTLSRDIAELLHAGYTLKEVMGFDMFPQTSHMETAVLLECRNK
jgi:23S rRNA (uracil1939-C5)-methyltransferase